MNRLRDKTVLITGASAGIGEACAQAFAAQGSALILWARREDRLRALAEELTKAHGVAVRTAAVDVRDRVAVDAAVEQIDATPDILVNNAGLASGLDMLHEGSFDDWDRMIDTNFKGLLNVSRAIIPGMVARNSGHVINIGSVAGHMVYPRGNVYCATKYAVRALSEGMSIDLAGTRVRVSSVDPGATETEFSLVRFAGDEKRANAVYEGFQPLTGDDVADAVIYVANTPPHVMVSGLVVQATAQRNPYVLTREEAK